MTKHNNKDQTVYNTGIILGGGGAKGVAHIAFLEKLEAMGIRRDIISGSSSGALVGALYSAGHSPEVILSFFRQTNLFRVTWVSPTKPGIFDSEKYISIFKEFLPPTFEELIIPLVITTVNLQKGYPEYFDTGDLYRPLLASCAVPLIFSPVRINDYLYADGGIMDNYPIAPLEGRARTIIGSYLNKPQEITEKELNTSLKVTNHANSLLIHAANEASIEGTDFTVQFELGSYGMFDNKRVDQIYNTAKMFLEHHDFHIPDVKEVP